MTSTLTRATVLAAVNGFPPETSWRKKVMPDVTHLPVMWLPVPEAAANSFPFGASRRISYACCGGTIQLISVSPTPLPSG